MTNEELSFKCAAVLGWQRDPIADAVLDVSWVYLPGTNSGVQENKLHESPAAVLAMICELGRRGVGVVPCEAGKPWATWDAVNIDRDIMVIVKLADYPTPEAALARCVMEAIYEVMK